MFIYKVTNLINNKVYVGQTIQSIKTRWNCHCKPSRERVSAISKAIQKYGKQNFKIEEIDGANSLTELNYLETYYIYKFNTLSPDGYNLSHGGNNKTLSREYKKNRQEIKEKSIVDTTTGDIYKNPEVVCKKFSISREVLMNNINRRTSFCKNRKFDFLCNWDGIILPKTKKTNPIVDTTTGIVYLDKYDLSNKLNISIVSINENLRGVSNSCKGRKFIKLTDWDGKISNKVIIEKPTFRKKVIELSTNKIFSSINSAAEEFKCSPQSITDNLHNRTNLVKYKYKFNYV